MRQGELKFFCTALLINEIHLSTKPLAVPELCHKQCPKYKNEEKARTPK